MLAFLRGAPSTVRNFMTSSGSFLVFFEFLVFFFCCEDFLVFLSVFPFFSRDFRGSVGIKNPCFFGGFPCRLPKKQGKEGQGRRNFSSFFVFSSIFSSIFRKPALIFQNHCLVEGDATKHFSVKERVFQWKGAGAIQ